jgi:hypothetical protein
VIFRNVPIADLFRQNDFAAGRCQALAGEVTGIRPIVHLVCFEDRNLTILLSEGLRERIAPGGLDGAHLLNIAGATGKHAKRPEDADDFQ